MYKYIFLILVTICLSGVVSGQDTSSDISSESSTDYSPTSGDLSVAVLFGRGNFLNAGLATPSSPNQFWYVSGAAPYNNTINENSNDASNIVGVELRYFVANNIAIKLSGGGIIRHTPARINVVGIIDPNSPNATWIPAYLSTPAEENLDFNANLGAEYHFTTDNGKLFPYLGVTVPFYYARHSVYDPTVYPIWMDFEGNSPGYVPGADDPVVDIGMRHAEIVGFGGQAVGGVDYYISNGLYLGLETKPVSYVYAYNTKLPAPGLEASQADNHSFSFFSQTFIKVGFRF